MDYKSSSDIILSNMNIGTKKVNMPSLPVETEQDNPVATGGLLRRIMNAKKARDKERFFNNIKNGKIRISTLNSCDDRLTFDICKRLIDYNVKYVIALRGKSPVPFLELVQYVLETVYPIPLYIYEQWMQEISLKTPLYKEIALKYINDSSMAIGNIDPNHSDFMLFFQKAFMAYGPMVLLKLNGKDVPYNIYLYAVKQNHSSLQYVREDHEIYDALCKFVLRESPEAQKYIDNNYYKLMNEIKKHNSEILRKNYSLLK